MSDKTINETFIKFSSKVPYTGSINLGDDLTVTVGNQVYTYNAVKSEDFDLQQDNKVDRVFTLKSTVE